MGRAYLADVSLQQQIDSLISRNESVVGLVIGQMQVSPGKDLIVHLVTTPAASGENGEEAASNKCLSIDAITDQCMTNHARQALRMLTGGFDIMGVFTCIHPDEAKNVQAKLRQVLFATHKSLSKVDNLVGVYSHTDRVVVQLCRLTKKLTCKTFDVSDHKSAGSPCELKFQKASDSFSQLQTSYTLDFVIPVPVTSMSSSLQKQILNGLQPVFSSLNHSVGVVNGRLLVDEETLSAPKTGNKVKGRQKHSDSSRGDGGESAAEVFAVDLLQTADASNADTVKMTECGAKMHIRGTIASRAYANVKATVGEAIQMLKKDIARSIVARCELLCEDLLQAEEDQDVKILYETPLRVFASLPSHRAVQFCDYLFPDETVSDSSERFRELLGLDITDEDIDTEAEHMPTDPDLLKPDKILDSDGVGNGSPNGTETSSHVARNIGLAAVFLVGLITAHFFYRYGSEFSDQESQS